MFSLFIHVAITNNHFLLLSSLRLYFEIKIFSNTGLTMPKLWPARSPRTLLQIYCFQLLLLTWNCLYTGQPLRKFSNRHSLRSNFQHFQPCSEQKFTYNTSNKLIQKVPITNYHQSSSVKINQINKSHLLEENFQV